MGSDLLTGGIFSTSGGELKNVPLTKTQKRARDYAAGLLGTVPDIPTAQIAGMTGSEQQGQNILSQYLKKPYEGYGESVGYLKDVLGGGYNPETSPYWAGYRANSLADEAQAASGLRRGSQLNGMFYSGPSMRAEADLRSGYGANRMQELGRIQNAERDRMTGAVSGLESLGREPLNRISAANQYGGLPRDIQNQQNAASYQAILQKLLFPYEQGMGVANTLFNNMQPDYYMQPPGESGMAQLGQLAQILGPLMMA